MAGKEPTGDQQADKPKHTLFWIIVAVFIVASIAGMMIGDMYGQARMGDAAKVRDAAEQ
ncbi:hypothetical protein GCM10025771_40340 [Niveibacterium umoris]|uniref:Flagellar basal body-associated protein FliL n=2 Tax=Niveibacterium umoris TaxID=1193620 RepID=A0A840BDJ0_9RHOO|nr:hypothetical protein [Niveibacterium umoris]MBB4010763.1 flagellar basal body-associated protein FliL [Niveibacterium umoris]